MCEKVLKPTTCNLTVFTVASNNEGWQVLYVSVWWPFAHKFSILTHPGSYILLVAVNLYLSQY
jgi:hypothetical protein